jgi:hypothetical protein
MAHNQRMAMPTALVGFAAACAAGAGVYGRWLSQAPMDSAMALLVVGGVGAGYFAWQISREGTAVLVGDAGVAVQRGSEVERLLWCDMQHIRLEGDHLVLTGAGPTISVSMASYAHAIRWILQEAAQRLPVLIEVPEGFLDRLPKTHATDGTRGPILALQTAGRRCKATRKVIRYERDARLCSICTQVYLKQEMPERCATCGNLLEGQAVVP